jgi:preprotein translocase subunit YajC
MILGFYFLLLRPQQKRRREMQSMQEAMGPGDEVITLGGLYGTIEATDDRDVLLEIAPGVTVRYSRAGIGNVITKAGQGEPAEPVDDTPEIEPGEGETPAAGKTAST